MGSTSSLVEQMHQTPHLNYKLEKQSNDFGIDYSVREYSLRQPYIQSVSIFPFIVFIAGIVFLAIFQCSLCSRSSKFCCGLCKCIGEDSKPSKTLWASFAISLLGAFVLYQALIYGDMYNTKGLDDAGGLVVLISHCVIV